MIRNFEMNTYDSPPLSSDPRKVVCSFHNTELYPQQICDKCLENKRERLYNMSNDCFLFELRLDLFKNQPMIIIRAYDGGWQIVSDGWPAKNKINIEVRQGGKVIFPLGSLWCATPRSIDGIEAKELVMSTVEMKPGDTDKDYFNSYTPEQLQWALKYGESISMERDRRYCDDDGNVKE